MQLHQAFKQHKVNRHNAAEALTNISQVVTSESWLMTSGSPHLNENMICSDRHFSATAHGQHTSGGGVHSQFMVNAQPVCS